MHAVVEVLSGFVVSAHAGNSKTLLPLPRNAAQEVIASEAIEAPTISRL
jgi:hypothetical protein